MIVSPSTAALAVALATGLAFALSFLLFGPIVTGLFDLAFPPSVAESARGAELYGFGLGFPYLLFIAPFCFLLGYSFIIFAFERRSWLSHSIVGALFWGLPSIFLFATTLVSSPLHSAELALRAAWIVSLGFAVFQAFVGALAGAACRAMLEWFGAMR